MSILATLLFYFVGLPISYTFLFIVLASVVTNSIKQIKQGEYGARLWYEKEKAKIGEEMVKRTTRSAMTKVDLDKVNL
jgi:hypothetical protein